MAANDLAHSSANLRTHAVDLLDKNLIGVAARAWLRRPFSAKAKLRVLIYHHPGPISRSQIEPFFYYAQGFRDRFGAEFRCRPVTDFLQCLPGPAADIFLVQPWFTTKGDEIATAFEALRIRSPEARFVFLDSFAHNDLRLGRFVDPFINLYLKKSLFRDRRNYLQPRRDTNLADYYSDLYGLDQQEPVDLQVPTSILPKLHLSPNFFSHGRFIRAFSQGRTPSWTGRRIDVQSRLGCKGSPWYSSMRKDALKRIMAISGLTLSASGELSLTAFMTELESARLCLSPFGYGELCWRDVEAIQAGSVMLKQDMDHLETLPNLYEPGVTYLPIRWDFSDLEQVVQESLADEGRLQTIAQTAWDRTAQYIRESRFVDDMAVIFSAL